MPRYWAGPVLEDAEVAVEDYVCRTCRKSIDERQPFFPFCSERCRLVDLGGWLSDRYRVSRSLSPSDKAASPLTAGEAEEDVSSGDAHDD